MPKGSQSQKEYQSNWRAEHPEYQKQYYQTETGKQVFRRAHLKHLYGITPEQYGVMFEQQKGCCAICHQPERSKQSKLLAVDHSHTDKRLRGLLCGNCNRALGLMQDSPARLQSAIEYLQRYF